MGQDFTISKKEELMIELNQTICFNWTVPSNSPVRVIHFQECIPCIRYAEDMQRVLGGGTLIASAFQL